MHKPKEIPRASRLMIQLGPMAEEVQERMAKEKERQAQAKHRRRDTGASEAQEEGRN